MATMPPDQQPATRRGHRPRGGWSSRAARRRACQRQLGELGLLGPRRLARSGGLDEDSPHFEGAAGRRLRVALPRLGPVFAAFGRYLGSRPDLLPAADCLELTGIEEMAPLAAIPPEEAGRRLAAAGVQLADFARLPLRWDLTGQTHRARLAGGEAVLVRLVHEDLEARIEPDLELLALLRPALPAAGRHGFPIERAVADFRQAFAVAADPRPQAEALTRLALETAALGELRLPRVAFAGPSLAVVEELPGRDVLELARSWWTIDPAAAAGGPGRPEPWWEASAAEDWTRAGGWSETQRADLARRLCLVWLRHALGGLPFAAALGGGELLVQADGRLALAGGQFAVLPAGSQANLRAYLIAAAAGDPDAAGACLLREMDAPGAPAGATAAAGAAGEGGAAAAAFLHQLRQAVAFRDGGWGRRAGIADAANGADGASGASGSSAAGAGHGRPGPAAATGQQLAETLFLHWRLAEAHGYRPRPHLLAFWRGLWQVAAAALELAPEADSVLAGLENLRTLDSAAQLGRLLDPRRMPGTAESYARAMLDGPAALEGALQQLAGDGPRVRIELAEPPGGGRRAGAALPVALAMALAAVGLATERLAAAPGFGRAAEGVGAALFVIVGALLIAALGRRG
jgi:hypothetical protein